MYHCGNCRYYKFIGNDEFAGKIGQCRINPPVVNEHRDVNNFPRVGEGAWCGQWKGGVYA